MLCELCNKNYKDKRILAYHLTVSHEDVSPKEYTIKYFYNGEVPKCKCGCNKDAPYRYFGRFMKYVSGHNSFVENPFKGKVHSKETIQKIMNAPGYKNRKLLGKFQPKTSEETKKKMRIAHLNNLIKNNGNFYMGKNEAEILDKQELVDGCKITRNYVIKNLGYVVDGYDEINNRVYEVYEKFHDKQVFEDLQRENKICNHLNCDFVILYDRTH